MKCLDDFLTEHFHEYGYVVGYVLSLILAIFLLFLVFADHAKKPYAKKCMAISAILIILYMCFEIIMFFKREYVFIMEEALAGLGELTPKISDLNTGGYKIGGYIFAAMLAISLGFVVYALATHKPHAKEYLIAWIVVVIFFIAFQVVG
ncbi:hypothetical protein [Tannerella forsythia]|jgi:hypothetical protein bfra3_23827|uniref:hypothetical protein n=1 Tax=Tannerella forsythia TaxID=28112 RepID=UPI001180E8BA|nr:hypothetical protein [Tannerella forsythia]